MLSVGPKSGAGLSSSPRTRLFYEYAKLGMTRETQAHASED